MGYVYNVMDSTEKNCWESSFPLANMHQIQRTVVLVGNKAKGRDSHFTNKIDNFCMHTTW